MALLTLVKVAVKRARLTRNFASISLVLERPEEEARFPRYKREEIIGWDHPALRSQIAPETVDFPFVKKKKTG